MPSIAEHTANDPTTPFTGAPEPKAKHMICEDVMTNFGLIFFSPESFIKAGSGSPANNRSAFKLHANASCEKRHSRFLFMHAWITDNGL